MSQPLLRVKTPPLLKRVVFDGYDYGLTLSFIRGANKVLLDWGGVFIRNVEHPYYKAWRVPKAKLHSSPEDLHQALLDLAGGAARESKESFLDKLNHSRSKPAISAFTFGLKMRIASLVNGGIIVMGDYHPGAVAIFNRLQGVYLSPMRAWRLGTSPEMLSNHLIEGLGLSECQLELLPVEHELLSDGSITPRGDVTRISVGKSLVQLGNAHQCRHPGESDIYLANIEPLKGTDWSQEELVSQLAGFSLYEYQLEGVKHLLMRTSALLADDMGLGKTRQAIVAAKLQAKNQPILVICLASLIVNWEREIKTVQPDAIIAKQSFEATAQWIIVNYERLGDFVCLASRFRVMLIDESHRIKEPAAECTRHAFSLAAQIPFRYLLRAANKTPLNLSLAMSTIEA